MKKAFDFRQSAGIFATVLILISAGIYFLGGTFTLFPSFIHAWSQSDRYALALGFLDNGFDFFHPRTFNLITTDGITRVDFPIHEYIVALLMKITGVHEPVVFRVYTFIYAIAGLTFLFKLAQLFTGFFYRNLFVVCFFFLCPVYLYYADGFLPGIPSLSNAFIGYYFYFRYKKSGAQKDFSLAIFFLTLAALARLPFIIFLFAVTCQQAAGYFTDKKISRREISVMGFAFAIFIFYQCYNSWLGNKYGTQFLVQILPASNIHQLKEWMKEAWSNWKFEYFSVAQYSILGILVLPLIANLFRKKIRGSNLNPLLLQGCIGITGSIIYLFLMLQQFPDHDYYFIDAFFPPLVLLIIFLVSFSFKNKIIDGILWIGIAFFMYESIAQVKVAIDRRYETHPWDRKEITRKNYLGSGAFLDSIGIPRNAKVLVLDGYTTNVPLILMNRQGWTVNWTTEEHIREGLANHWDIVAIQNSFSASDVVRNYPGIISQLTKFADNGLISIYRKENTKQSREKFFGIDSASVLYKSDAKDLALDAASDYFNLFQDSSSIFISGHPTKILVSGSIKCGEGKPNLVASMNDQDSTYYYFLFDLDSYIKTDSWQPLLFQFVVPARNRPSGTVKVYLWNDRKVPCTINDMQVVVYR